MARYNLASQEGAVPPEQGMSDEKDIAKIREEETQRGRRPKHAQEKERWQRLKKMYDDYQRAKR